MTKHWTGSAPSLDLLVAAMLAAIGAIQLAMTFLAVPGVAAVAYGWLGFVPLSGEHRSAQEGWGSSEICRVALVGRVRAPAGRSVPIGSATHTATEPIQASALELRARAAGSRWIGGRRDRSCVCGSPDSLLGHASGLKQTSKALTGLVTSAPFGSVVVKLRRSLEGALTVEQLLAWV